MFGIDEYLSTCESIFRDHVSSSLVLRRLEDVDRANDDPTPVYRLADTCNELGYPELWQLGVAVAFSRSHCTYEHAFLRGQAKLRLADWAGWADFEARLFNPGWGCSRADALSWSHRRWDGIDDLSEQTLFIRHQGGFGDDILMIRFIPPLADRVGRVVLDVKAELVGFVRDNLGHLATVAHVGRDWRQIHFDQYIWSMSLPFAVGYLPPFTPLTAGTPLASEKTTRGTRQIGICWACSDTASDHRDRSLPLDLLASLFEDTSARWTSLQVGTSAADAGRHSTLCSTTPLRTFADTAAVIAKVDAVVSVDTAVCHLAGALGIPTYLLLRCGSDWKWGFGDTTPWYPTMRIIRQRSPGDWSSAMDELAIALGKL